MNAELPVSYAPRVNPITLTPLTASVPNTFVVPPTLPILTVVAAPPIRIAVAVVLNIKPVGDAASIDEVVTD